MASALFKLRLIYKKKVFLLSQVGTPSKNIIIASNFANAKYGLLETQLRIANIVILFYSAKHF